MPATAGIGRSLGALSSRLRLYRRRARSALGAVLEDCRRGPDALGERGAIATACVQFRVRG